MEKSARNNSDPVDWGDKRAQTTRNTQTPTTSSCASASSGGTRGGHSSRPFHHRAVCVHSQQSKEAPWSTSYLGSWLKSNCNQLQSTRGQGIHSHW